MKHLIFLALLFFSLNLNAQRDTLDYHLAVDTDSLIYTVGGGDTTFTYIDTINERHNKHYYVSSFDLLDSLAFALDAEISTLEAQTEASYNEYIRQNTKLWNKRKMFARIEELITELYVP
jgi:hypothetical protein